MMKKHEEALPLVSVIIPVYRVEKYIGACIGSIIRQTYKRTEIILVDDCGGDDSIKVAEDLLRSSSLSWMTVRHERNRGLSAARNTGVEKSQGDYIFFLDSDDLLSPQCLELLVERALHDDADMTTGQVATLLENSNTTSYYAYNKACQGQDVLNALLQQDLAVTAWNKLIKRSFYDQSGVSFREGILHEDEVWSFELALCSPKVSCIDVVTYFYLQRGGSIMAGDHLDDRHFEGRLASFTCFNQHSSHFLCRHNPIFWESYYELFMALCWSVAEVPSWWTRLKRYCSLLTLTYLPHDIPFDRSRHLSGIVKCLSYVFPYTWLLMALYGLARCQIASKDTRE